MEVLRGTSKSGKVYRIYDGCPICGVYTIEFLKRDEESDFDMWCPAYEPKNKVFGKLSEAKIAFEAFLET